MKKQLILSLALVFGVSMMPATVALANDAEQVEVHSTKENPKKTYLRLLNNFCAEYYSSMFPNQSFSKGSVVVKEVIEEGTGRVRVIGTHHFRGANGKKYFHKSFSALVYSEGSRLLRIDFRKQNPADLTHTDDYWVENSVEFGKSTQQMDREAEQQFVHRLYTCINKYCLRNYSSCFSGRTYVKNSIKVKKYEYDEENQSITVWGTHSYKGRQGAEYNDYDFRAILDYDVTGDTDYLEVMKFYKRSAPDLLHSSAYWEQCGK